MESAALPRFFYCTTSNLQTLPERPGRVINKKCSSTLTNLANLSSNGSINCFKSVSPTKRAGLQIACAKTSDLKVTAKADDSCQKGSSNHKSTWRVGFPSAFQELVTEVCDETEIAELRVKVGDFEMHVKRDLAPSASKQVVYSPPNPSITAIESPPAPRVEQKAYSEKVSAFTNISPEKAFELAKLEASGASGYVLVPSPIVGSFRRGRTVKEVKQPPSCKEGDIIKEGQVIGYIDQFGTELPVKSDVGGKVLKFLYQDGEAAGYGDTLIAVLP